MALEWGETVRKAEQLVETAMKGNDASHDAAHSFRVRDLALSLAHEEESLSSSSDSIHIVSKLLMICYFLVLSFLGNQTEC